MPINTSLANDMQIIYAINENNMLMLSVTKILCVSIYVCHKYLCVLGTKILT